MRSTRLALLVGLVLTITTLFGCSPTAPETSAPAESGAPSAAADPESELAVADSSLGKIIVDGDQMTAYYFTKDVANSGKSACLGECLTAWPPITTTSEMPAVDGITATIGTITLDDGTQQITVDGMPIYLFAKDKAPGDVTGQGVGEVWYVVAPDGTMITGAAPSDGY